MNDYWFRRRWVDGRSGHSIYLMFGLTFVNFVIIAYRFLIEKDTVFEEIFESMWIFGLIFLVTYIPVSIIIGYWHRKTQLKVEMTLKYLEAPFFAKMFRVLLDTETGKANKEEIEEFKKILSNIEKK
jgi:uncharacterized protein (DUF2235 family)